MDVGRRTFEAANGIVELDLSDTVYAHDADAYQQVLRDAPWRRDPEFFQHVRISAIALLKMVLHAKSGGSFEVMGLMQGRACQRHARYMCLTRSRCRCTAPRRA